MRYWLFKSEPNTFSIDDLSKLPQQTDHWEGIRNFQVRNLLRSVIKKGDQAFFYHSSCNPPGIVGVIEVVKEGYPDLSAFDKSSPYYDPKSSVDNPRWYRVDVKLIKKFPRLVALEELKRHPKLSNMQVTRKGNRLSITAVTPEEWVIILNRAKSVSS